MKITHIASRPNQADFALVTINESEDQAVRDVFLGDQTLLEEHRLPGDRGVFTWWQMQGKASSDQYVVIHASTGDAKGLLPAIEVVRELDRLFKPRFLLVLGTAGGIRDRGIEYGHVIFSRQVHVGYQQLLDGPSPEGGPCEVCVHLFDDPIQPPSDRLYFHAKNAALDWRPTPAMKVAAEGVAEAIALIAQGSPNDRTWIDSLNTNLEQAFTRTPESTEIFSGSYLIDGRNSELFASIKRTFPKVGAVEMEAGAVAQAVLHSTDTEHFLGIL